MKKFFFAVLFGCLSFFVFAQSKTEFKSMISTFLQKGSYINIVPLSKEANTTTYKKTDTSIESALNGLFGTSSSSSSSNNDYDYKEYDVKETLYPKSTITKFEFNDDTLVSFTTGNTTVRLWDAIDKVRPTDFKYYLDENYNFIITVK